ncbi:MAG TPA: hypothetical protein VMB25_21955, partial [Bryobacteraceae bacterium]|nr:hypothetical protein [Bryobacteraceae bacterium]
MYCPNCGLALLPSDQKTAIDAYIAAKVAQEVALKTQDESSVVRSIANDAEDEIWKRLKRYAWLGALALFLLGLYGFNSIRDAKQKIVDEARSRVEPVVKDVEQRAQAGQAKLADVEKRLPKLTESLNKTSELADQQRKRIEGQGAEVTAKLNKFTAATTRAEQLSASFEAKVADAQRRLAELTKRYDTQLNQISRAVTHTAVSEAFPNLDQEPFIAIGNDRFDRIVKKPDEKWVNIYITQP